MSGKTWASVVVLQEAQELKKGGQGDVQSFFLSVHNIPFQEKGPGEENKQNNPSRGGGG